MCRAEGCAATPAGGADCGDPRDAAKLLQATARLEAPLANQSGDWSDEWLDDPRFPSWSAHRKHVKGKYPEEGPWHFVRNPGSRVLVYPEKKLAFCYIEKNACTQFNLLFNHLNGKRGKWWISTVDALSLDLANITREKGWKWAVFLRDPLVRYLSAWGSKCWQKEDGGSNCVPRGDFTKDASLADFLAHVSANVEDPSPTAANPHWALQQAFCGGLRNAGGYDFVGHLRGDVNGQVHQMLRMAGAPRGGVEQFFPKGGHRGHHTSLDPAVYYAGTATVGNVGSLYGPDYSLPGL